MLNFLTNVFKGNSNARNTCGSDMDVIQGCVGCDGECLYSCDSVCASECQGNSKDTGGGGDGNCNSQCTGTCFSIASIILGK